MSITTGWKALAFVGIIAVGILLFAQQGNAQRTRASLPASEYQIVAVPGNNTATSAVVRINTRTGQSWKLVHYTRVEVQSNGLPSMGYSTNSYVALSDEWEPIYEPGEAPVAQE